MRVFVLEDEIHRYPRNQIKTALAGHDVTIATCQPEGVRLYAGPYDLLLLDHDMEGFFESSHYANTGYQFCCWMTGAHPAHRAKVVLHSQNGDGRRNMHRLLRQSGYRDVWEQPFGYGYITWLQGALGNVLALRG